VRIWYFGNPVPKGFVSGFLDPRAFRLIPPTTIVRPPPTVIAVAVIGSIAVAVVVPSIAIAIIVPSIAVIATAIVIDVFKRCVALRQRCQTSYAGRHCCICLPDE
jgi:hypothetical protein